MALLFGCAGILMAVGLVFGAVAFLTVAAPQVDAIVAYSSDPHSFIRPVFEGFAPPAGLRFVVEDNSGVAECLFGDCATVTRYYASDEDPERTCELAADALIAWGLTRNADTVIGRCAFDGTIDGTVVWVSFVHDARRAYLGAPIDVPHASLVVISAQRR